MAASGRHTCPECGRDTAAQVQVTTGVSAASIAVHGERLTVNHCDCGYVQVPSSLGRAARSTAGGSLPAARHTLLRPDRCRGCRAVLTMPGRRTERVVSVLPDDLPVVTLRFDLPMIRCPACGMDQLPARARADVDVALAALLQAAADEATGTPRIDPSQLGPWERLAWLTKRARGR